MREVDQILQGFSSPAPWSVLPLQTPFVLERDYPFDQLRFLEFVLSGEGVFVRTFELLHALTKNLALLRVHSVLVLNGRPLP